MKAIITALCAILMAFSVSSWAGNVDENTTWTAFSTQQITVPVAEAIGTSITVNRFITGSAVHAYIDATVSGGTFTVYLVCAETTSGARYKDVASVVTISATGKYHYRFPTDTGCFGAGTGRYCALAVTGASAESTASIVMKREN